MDIIHFIINPVTAYGCIIVAIICFRREKASISQALMIPFRRATLIFKPKFTEIFTVPGIILLILGSLIALIDVVAL